MHLNLPPIYVFLLKIIMTLVITTNRVISSIYIYSHSNNHVWLKGILSLCFKMFSKVYHNNIIKKCLKLQKICFDNIKYPVQHRRRFTWNVILSSIHDDMNWREISTSSKIAAAISYCRYDCFTIWIRYISRAITLYCNMIYIYSLNLLKTIK